MRKILKRIFLVLLVLLVVAQIPFVYRRYQTGKLAAKITQLEAQRTTSADANFKEYKGIIHAHTALGGHSTGTFEELIAAANSNDLDFVLMTEHHSDTFDTSAQTPNGVFGKTLFVGGNEIDTTDGDRFLLIPGGGEAAKARMSGTTAFLETAHRENKLALITYPEKFKSWDSQFDGIEVFSLHTAAKQMNPVTALGDLIWTYPSYPELMLAKGWTRPDVNLAKFDETVARRPVSLFVGTDAHSNIGGHLFGDDAGNKLIDIKLDPYATIFRMARMHVLIEKDKEFNRETLIEAVRAGRFFVGFDALGDTSGFRFQLSDRSMGETVDSTRFPDLTLLVPSAARACLYANGNLIGCDGEVLAAARMSKQPFEPGAYRVEVYRDDLGPPFDKMPWILSNPIFVR